MATSNRVFVSPGVYTSETDLTFVAQSVGVTTLGLVGETLKGPAFEPILISNFDEFKTFFGDISPLKDGNGNPKYELPYVAKSYLEESNQLFVTRILGKTGYKPNITFGIKTLGGIVLGDLSSQSSVTIAPGDTGFTSGSAYGSIAITKTTSSGVSLESYLESNFSGYTTGHTDEWFTFGYVPTDQLPISGVQLNSPLTGDLTNEPTNRLWRNDFYTQSTPGDDTTVDYLYSYLFVYDGGTSKFNVTEFKFEATLDTTYHNITVAALRSRGSYTSQALNLEVTSLTGITLSNTTDLGLDPFSEFSINVTGLTSQAKTFVCSLDSSSKKYISKVLGTEVFDKPKSDFPVYVYEIYPTLISKAYEMGHIRGISSTLISNIEDSGSNNNFLSSWTTSASPFVVSEVRGNTVSDLFRVITISDGESSNTQVKITIMNINIETMEFDLFVRNFNDTDDNMVMIEKYSRCSMNPYNPGFIGKKIGTSDGEYELRSKHIMIELAENYPVDAIPAGFRGYDSNTSFGSSTLGEIIYKTKYYSSGDVIGYDAQGNELISSGDKLRKVSLGISSQIGFDSDLLKFKGKETTGVTDGFHLSTNASNISGFKTTEYDLEGINKGLLSNIAYRKFTFATAGGFDGWDIYRDVRTFGDQYVFSTNPNSVYYSGTTSQTGVFSPTSGNSDYYAFLDGIDTFSNPESVNINVFATPGLNFRDHSSLTSEAIEMIENDRADSIYIISPPNETDAETIIDDLQSTSFDSNYSAVYWPWIQVRDTTNATQIYLPPTGEIVRNIALTDNVSYPWFATAGYARGLVKSIKAIKKLTQDERDILYKNRINPIATFSDTGTIIWGNNTLQVRESALNKLNVRRLLLRARKLISAVSVRLVFDQNDEQVRNDFYRLVNPILESIKKERGLSEFYVKVSDDVEDLDSSTLRAKLFIRPIKSLEFLEIEFVVGNSGASFDNI